MEQIIFRRTPPHEFVQRFIMMNENRGMQVSLNQGLCIIAVTEDEEQIDYWQGPAFVESCREDFYAVFAQVVAKYVEIGSFFEELND